MSTVKSAKNTGSATGYEVHGYCNYCGPNTGVMRVYYLKGHGYLCNAHKIQWQRNDSQATKQLQKDRDYWKDAWASTGNKPGTY